MSWPFAPHLLRLLEEQVLIATDAQETRALIRILDNLCHHNSAGIFHVEAAAVSQVLLVADTLELLPGSYTGNLTVSSLADRAGWQRIPVNLRVLPFQLAVLAGAKVPT